MALKRLTHERFARLRSRGELPDLPDEPTPPPLPAPEPALTRGGEPRHPRWPRVMALVREGDVVNAHFVAEAPTVLRATMIASRYAWRAVVTDAHGSRHFDNRKPIEVA